MLTLDFRDLDETMSISVVVPAQPKRSGLIKVRRDVNDMQPTPIPAVAIEDLPMLYAEDLRYPWLDKTLLAIAGTFGAAGFLALGWIIGVML